MFSRLKRKAMLLKQELTSVYYAYQHPGLPFLPKAVIFITLGYALSPIDLIPDFIPVLGYLDDIIIIPALITLSLKLIPADIMEAARNRALQEPLHLKKNRLFALLFILIWTVLLAVVVLAIIRLCLPPMRTNAYGYGNFPFFAFFTFLSFT